MKRSNQTPLSTIIEEKTSKPNDFGFNGILTGQREHLSSREAARWATEFGNEHFLHVSNYTDKELLTPYKLQRMNALPALTKPQKERAKIYKQHQHKHPKPNPTVAQKIAQKKYIRGQQINRIKSSPQAPRARRRLDFSEATEDATPSNTSTPRRNNRSISSLFNQLSTSPSTTSGNYSRTYILSTPVNQQQPPRNKIASTPPPPKKKPDPPGKTDTELPSTPDEINLPSTPTPEPASDTSLSSDTNTDEPTGPQNHPSTSTPKKFKVGTFLRRLWWPCRRSHQ